MDTVDRTLGLFLATACAAAVAWFPQTADAAGIDATVNHRKLVDGPVSVAFHGGELVQGNPNYVMLRAGSGRVRLSINNLSKLTEISCSMGKGDPSDAQPKTFSVVEYYSNASGSYATGVTRSITAGGHKELKFTVPPGPAGKYWYDIEGGSTTDSSFAECRVKTLGADERHPAAGLAEAARGNTRTPSAARTPDSRSSRDTAAPISGGRTLRRLSRKEQRTRRIESKPRSRARAAPAPASHTFGPWRLVSESKQAMLLTADFFSWSPTLGLGMSGSNSFAATVQIPSGKSAVLDCKVDVGRAVPPNFAITVKQSGGPETTKALKQGTQHLVVGVPRVIGLETLFVEGNGDNGNMGAWTLRECEVSFH